MGYQYFIFSFVVGICFLREFAQGTDCFSSPRNIMFLIDSSDVIRSSRFSSEKVFLRYMSDHLMDANAMTKIGIATFTDTAHIQIDMNQFQTKSQFLDEIQDVWYSIGNADLESALTAIIQLGFVNMATTRAKMENIIILVTHVSIQDQDKLRSFGQQLTNKSIELYIITVGSYSIMDALRKLASSDNMFHTNSIDELPLVQDSLISVICKGVARGILSQWSPWSACGVTCGLGFQERYRICTKLHNNDVDCEGPLFERQRCNDGDCKTPLDGQWSFWGKWTICSKTCGGGTQARRRQCDNPPPLNGGRNCPGIAEQTTNCSVWACPDCSKICPPGGQLSKPNCDLCVCSSTNLFGTVNDVTNRSIADANIFLESKPSHPSAVTDNRGRYQINNVCMMGETILVAKDGYSRASAQPVPVNDTHWEASFSIEHLISPQFVTHPQSKHRFAGQSVTLCCEARGDPQPNLYTWLKNNILLEDVGQDGTLEFASLLMSDAGTYTCSVETIAGIALSDTAVLTVQADGVHDTCFGRKSQLEDLPPTCHVVADDGTRSTTIDVGTCGSESCMSLDLHDNGTCTEWWPRHCCAADSYDLVDVICDGFSYKMNKVRSCRCQLCVHKTTISGVIKGSENGVDVPMKLGSLYINGKKAAMTNMRGYFNLEVPKGMARVVINIIDENFNKFVTSTKIVNVEEGLSSTVNIVIPLRPKPIPINTALGADIPLGSDSGMSPAATLSIPPDSVYTRDGKPFTGTAHAEIQFMDPRKLNDMEAANGELVFKAQNGEIRPLETFGMFDVSMSDGNGQQLKINGAMNISLDASVFNITKNEDGDPNLQLWYFDINKGVWVKIGDMKFSSANSGTNRKLLDMMIVGSFTPIEIPMISLTEEVYNIRRDRYISGWTNCDHSTPIYSYTDVRVRGPDKVKDGACFVSVTVYTDLALREPMSGISVVAATQDKYDSRFKGFSKKTTDRYGHVCLDIFCDANIFLYAEDRSNGQRLFASLNHDLPPGYSFSNTKNGTEVLFESVNREYVPTPGGIPRYSPVLYFNDVDKIKCIQDHEKNYKFQFAPATKEPKLDTTVSSNDNKNKLSWYFLPADKPGRKACFIKVLVKIPTFDSRIIATSYQRLTSNAANMYGTYNVGPTFDSTINDRDTKAACVEFRCPGLVNENGTTIFDVPTLVHVSLATNRTCRFSVNASGLATSIRPGVGGKQFQFYVEVLKNYGPKFGVYINNGDSEKVRHYCMSGTDSGNIGNIMKPLINPAVQFTCA